MAIEAGSFSGLHKVCEVLSNSFCESEIPSLKCSVRMLLKLLQLSSGFKCRCWGSNSWENQLSGVHSSSLKKTNKETSNSLFQSRLYYYSFPFHIINQSDLSWFFEKHFRSGTEDKFQKEILKEAHFSNIIFIH